MHPKYKRMLKVMQAKEKARLRRQKKKIKVKKRSIKNIPPLAEPWFLYILRCSDGSLYTGVTKDIERRFKMHERGVASRYTRTRRPVELLYQENCLSRTQALVRECAVKALPKVKKERLILNGT